MENTRTRAHREREIEKEKEREIEPLLDPTYFRQWQDYFEENMEQTSSPAPSLARYYIENNKKKTFIVVIMLMKAYYQLPIVVA